MPTENSALNEDAGSTDTGCADLESAALWTLPAGAD